MSVVFTDNFTVGANTNIDAYPAAGADYAYNLGSGANLTVNAANDRVQQTATGADHAARIIDASVPTTDQQMSITSFSSGSEDSTGNACVRMKTDGTGNFYLCYASKNGGNILIYRVVAGAFTQIASGTRTWTPPSTLIFKATGTNPVSLLANIAGTADLTFDDSNASRHQTGVPGIHMFSTTINVSYIDDVSVDDLGTGGGLTDGQSLLWVGVT